MNDSVEPSELVISYAVHSTGTEKNPEYRRLQEALEKGYSVVDVISTTANAGASANGFVAVTVVLAHPERASSDRYKGGAVRNR